MGAISGQELETAEKRLKAEVLEEAIKAVPDDLPVESRLLSGDPPEAIASAAKDLDLLIVGSRGYGPVRRVLLGGFSARVIRSAPCPVLVLPRAAGEDPLSLDAGA
jgi:nucleotide-binding universal stress UspA family protein